MPPAVVGTRVASPSIRSPTRQLRLLDQAEVAGPRPRCRSGSARCRARRRRRARARGRRGSGAPSGWGRAAATPRCVRPVPDAATPSLGRRLLHLAQDPGQAVDDGDHDGQADEGAGQAAARAADRRAACAEESDGRLSGVFSPRVLAGAGREDRSGRQEDAEVCGRAGGREGTEVASLEGLGRSGGTTSQSLDRPVRSGLEGGVWTTVRRRPQLERCVLMPRSARWELGGREVARAEGFAAGSPRRPAARACTAPLTSVMRRPNCSSMTTTSPRAIGRPLTSRSTGLSARRSSVTTEPWPRRHRLAQRHVGAADLDGQLDGHVGQAREVRVAGDGACGAGRRGAG